MILRIVLGVVVLAAILGVGYVVTQDGTTSSSNQQGTIEQPRVVQPIVPQRPSNTTREEDDAIESIKIRP